MASEYWEGTTRRGLVEGEDIKGTSLIDLSADDFYRTSSYSKGAPETGRLFA
jgi:hypothetical protein